MRCVLVSEDTALFTVLILKVQGGEGRRDGGTFRSHFRSVIQKETGSVSVIPVSAILQLSAAVEESRHGLVCPVYY